MATMSPKAGSSATTNKKPSARVLKKTKSIVVPQSVSPIPDNSRPVFIETMQGLEWYFSGISALEHLFRRQHSGFHIVSVIGSIADLAKRVDKLLFPRMEGIDACADFTDGRYYFRCDETGLPIPPYRIPALDFYWNHATRRFVDPRGNYSSVRDKSWAPMLSMAGSYSDIRPEDIPQLAIFVSRFMSSVDPRKLHSYTEEEWPIFGIEEQRLLLSAVLTGPYAERGLAALRESGYVAKFLPELVAMDGTHHSKEGHPEGNVWEHSLETLKYRKVTNLSLSLALLLHDSGKPLSVPTRQKMFDKHAEIGADLAEKLLSRLNFDHKTNNEVCWLVKHHMIPQALDELPLSRTERLMEQELFPLLLELYRCDLSSTWRGPEGYYDACKKFRVWLKTRRNPYLNLDRKRQIQRFVAS